MDRIRDMWLRWRYGLLAVGLGLLVFLPSLWNGFVYDDNSYIVNNRWIRSWANMGDLLVNPAAASGVDAVIGIWRPLRNVHYLVDHTIAGLNPWWWHAMNLVWHGMAIFALFLLGRRLGLLPALAGAAAALYAVHPVQSESVLWVKERDGLMSGAFLFIALWASLGDSWRARAGGLLALAAGLLSKETPVVFCVLFPLCALAAWMRGRRDPDFRRSAIVVTAVSVLLVLLYLVVRHLLVGQTSQAAPIGGSFGVTLWTMGAVFARYVGLAIVPLRLPLSYDHIEPLALAAPAAWGGWLIVLGLLVAGIALFRRAPVAGLGVLWFLVALAPFSNLVPMMQWMAVRFLYVPIAGACLAAAVGLGALHEKFTQKGQGYLGTVPLAGVIFALVMTFFASQTFQRNFPWRSQYTLFIDAYRQNPESRFAMTSYAGIAYDEGRFEEVLSILEPYPFDSPQQVDENAWHLKSWALFQLGQRETALETLRQGHEALSRESAFFLDSLALMNRLSGDNDRAIELWEEALRRYPFDLQSHVSLIEAYRAAGREKDAATLIERLRVFKDRPRSEWRDGVHELRPWASSD